MNFLDLFSIDFLIFFFTSVLFFSVLMLSYSYTQRQEKISRLRAIATSTKKRIRLLQIKKQKVQVTNQKIDYREKIETFVRKNLVQFTEDKASDFRSLFERAGWSPINAAVVYSVFKTISTITCGISAYILTESVPFFMGQSQLIHFAFIVAGTFIGSKGFDIFIKLQINAREDLIKRDMSSALDLLSICTNAGLSIDRSLEYVSEELVASNMELCKELAITSIELSILPERSQAFRNLGKRVDVPLVRAITTTLIQSEEQGTSISSTLKVLAGDFRHQKMLELESRASKLPALLSLPIILFTLPTLLIMILGPSIITMIHELG